jgi:hypothetical protein
MQGFLPTSLKKKTRERVIFLLSYLQFYIRNKQGKTHATSLGYSDIFKGEKADSVYRGYRDDTYDTHDTHDTVAIHSIPSRYVRYHGDPYNPYDPAIHNPLFPLGYLLCIYYVFLIETFLDHNAF